MTTTSITHVNKDNISKSNNNEGHIPKYKQLKKELYLYIQGATRHNAHVRDRMEIFFKHLEDMFFNERIDINEFGFL